MGILFVDIGFTPRGFRKSYVKFRNCSINICTMMQHIGARELHRDAFGTRQCNIMMHEIFKCDFQNLRRENYLTRKVSVLRDVFRA